MRTRLSSIPMLIYRLARRDHDKVAVVDSDLKRYTYRQLNCMADSIRNLFPMAEPTRVGVLTGAGVGQITAILAVIKNGGAYVPLDPALNGACLRRVAREANVDFVIADKANVGRLGDIPAVELPEKIEYTESDGYAPINFGSRAVACAMPVGGGRFQELACVAVRRHASSLCDEFGVSPSDVVMQSSVVTSPMFLAEVFATMMKGATLAILPEKNRGYAKAIADFAERTGVTVICGYRSMVDDLGLLHRLPSRLRMLIGMASDKLSGAFANFNKSDAWRGWFSIDFRRPVALS